jgi:hypothetical protein
MFRSTLLMSDEWATNNYPSPLPEAAKPVTTKFIGRLGRKFEGSQLFRQVVRWANRQVEGSKWRVAVGEW